MSGFVILCLDGKNEKLNHHVTIFKKEQQLIKVND